MSAGADELIKIDEEAKEHMDNALYGGLDANMNQQKMAEVQFEAWMRLLDSRVNVQSRFCNGRGKAACFWSLKYVSRRILAKF